jgi:hypothetical protein
MFCVYCGGETRTRDHCPPKVFLDEPYPDDLQIVPACLECNQRASLDEEYTACLIDCVIAGSADPAMVRRLKIRNILDKKPSLVSKFTFARRELDGKTIFSVEHGRIGNVVRKLAQGHVAYDLNEPQLDEPSAIGYIPFENMDGVARDQFESSIDPVGLHAWPEVGSRAMQRLIESDPEEAVWIEVQPGRYRYQVSLAGGIAVRMVIGEYLACEVRWSSTRIWEEQ